VDFAPMITLVAEDFAKNRANAIGSAEMSKWQPSNEANLDWPRLTMNTVAEGPRHDVFVKLHNS
jgi:hypothetical protein